MEKPDDDKIPTDAPILDYASPSTGKFVTIAQFSSEAEARMAASKLDSEEIAAVVKPAVDAIGIYTGGASASLSVPAEEAKKAIEILKTTPARTNIVPDL
ncbi:MAG: hypothetical protein ABSG31_13370 [Tepidisphaeraceae bacterium]|jgi:hypothetical protein